MEVHSSTLTIVALLLYGAAIIVTYINAFKNNKIYKRITLGLMVLSVILFLLNGEWLTNSFDILIYIGYIAIGLPLLMLASIIKGAIEIKKKKIKFNSLPVIISTIMFIILVVMVNSNENDLFLVYDFLLLIALLSFILLDINAQKKQ